MILTAAAFVAGFVDSIVGGGGLIQIPLALVLFPNAPAATIIGTTKLPSFTGTSIAAYRYSRHVPLNYKHVLIMGCIAMPMSFLGSWTLTLIHNDFLKPMLVIVLSCVVAYIYIKKDFGIHTEKDHTEFEHTLYCVIMSVVFGFYDGFIGPGTGSFFIMAFITFLGYDFLKAGATAKFINIATNVGSIIMFASSGNILYEVAVPMMAANGLGGYVGSKLAILRGNKFIRVFFLCVVTATLLRFAWDVFKP